MKKQRMPPIFQHESLQNAMLILMLWQKRKDRWREVVNGQLESWVFEPRPLSDSPLRSLGKSVHLNRPDKKH